MNNEIIIKLIEELPDIIVLAILLLISFKIGSFLKIIAYIREGVCINAHASRALLEIFTEVHKTKNPVYVCSLISILNEKPSLPIEIIAEDGECISLMDGDKLDMDKAISFATFIVQGLYITNDSIMLEIKRREPTDEKSES